MLCHRTVLVYDNSLSRHNSNSHLPLPSVDNFSIATWLYGTFSARTYASLFESIELSSRDIFISSRYVCNFFSSSYSSSYYSSLTARPVVANDSSRDRNLPSTAFSTIGRAISLDKPMHFMLSKVDKINDFSSAAEYSRSFDNTSTE